MPLYHYRCATCKAELEIQQRITEPALTDCPNCDTNGLKRVIGLGGGFVLKGTGFYNTDYKNVSATKSEAKPADVKTETTTETKPTAHTCGAGCAH